MQKTITLNYPDNLPKVRLLYDLLEFAFKAGQEYEHNCNCGRCDYCIDVNANSPDFVEWFNQQNF